MFWSEARAVAGARSPQMSSISCSCVRSSRAWRSNVARSARSSLPPSGSGRFASTTSSGPRIRNVTPAGRGRQRLFPGCASGSTRRTSFHSTMTAGTDECGRVESNHHSRGRRGYSPLSSPVLSVRTRGSRPGSNRCCGDHDPGCCRYTTATMRRGRPGSNRRPLARQASALLF
jgi:hypothetical protein